MQHGSKCWMGGGQCGWSPAAWIPRHPDQRVLEWKMLVLPTSQSVCQILHLCLQIPARGDGWCRRRQRPAVDRRGISQTWASWQSVISKSRCHLLQPSGFLSLSWPTWRADIKGWIRRKALPSSYLHFSLSHLHYWGITTQAHLIKWLIQKQGVAMGDPVLVTEQVNIQFPSLREAVKSYILFKVKQVSVKEVRRRHWHICAGVFIFCLCPSLGGLFPC